MSHLKCSLQPCVPDFIPGCMSYCIQTNFLFSNLVSSNWEPILIIPSLFISFTETGVWPQSHNLAMSCWMPPEFSQDVYFKPPCSCPRAHMLAPSWPLGCHLFIVWNSYTIPHLNGVCSPSYSFPSPGAEILTWEDLNHNMIGRNVNKQQINGGGAGGTETVEKMLGGFLSIAEDAG